MEAKKLKEFIELMEDNNLCELEIEEGGKRIRLKKNFAELPTAISAVPPPVSLAAPQEQKSGKNTLEIKSPMVGTFYTSPSPGAKPYVSIGDIVNSGDIICIVEAMKLMNEIKAEVGGKVVQILIENGEPIEFGQTLFTIEPA